MDWIPPTPEKRRDIHFYIRQTYVDQYDAMCKANDVSRAVQFMHILDKIAEDQKNGGS